MHFPLFQAILANHYDWLSYDEVNKQVTHLGSGLQALGQQPKKNICIFAETRADWMSTAQACFKYNFPGKHRCGLAFNSFHFLGQLIHLKSLVGGDLSSTKPTPNILKRIIHLDPMLF